MNDELMPNAVKRDWVKCPICGECDMRKEEDAEGNALILCVNHACASNGGDNCSAINTRHDSELVEGLIEAVNEGLSWMACYCGHPACKKCKGTKFMNQILNNARKVKG